MLNPCRTCIPSWSPYFKLLVAFVLGWLSLPVIAETSWQALNQPGKRESVYFATVELPYIDVYSGAGRGYPVFHVIERGEAFAVIKRRNDWFKIVTSTNVTGWVKASALNGNSDGLGESIAIANVDSDNFGQRPFEVGITVGDFGGTDSVSLYGSYHFIEKMAGVLTYSENFGDVSNGRTVGLTLEARPFPTWRLSPFFSLGGGQRWTSPKQSQAQGDTVNNGFFLVGGGVHLFLTSRFAFRAEFNQHIVLTNLDDDQQINEWKIGLSTFF